MGILEDVIKALERIPAWKRVTALPQEVAALEARIAALEKRPAAAICVHCPRCRAMTFMLQSTGPATQPWGRMGVFREEYLCSSCGHQDIRERNPGC